MKWIWNRCRRRQDISLLAAGALDQEEKTELERHLAACEDCRTYYGEIKALTAPLSVWQNKWSAVEATPAARMRWARAVQEAVPASAPNLNRNPNPNPNPQRLRLSFRRRGSAALPSMGSALLPQRPNLKFPLLGLGFWRIVWRELILPHRYAWSSMAALWVAMLAINAQLSDHQASNAGSRASSSQEMLQAWLEQNRVLAELVQPAAAVPAPPPYVPGPRSQRKQRRATI